jgi:hypothetical protein
MPTYSEHREWPLTEREWAQRIEQVGQQRLVGPDGKDREAAPKASPPAPRFISRKEWRATAPTQTDTVNFWPEWGGIVLHYAGGGKEMREEHSPGRTPAPFDDCYYQVRLIQHRHMHPSPITGGERYWDIAYNYLICHHGYTFVGRGLASQPGANGSRYTNERYYAICGLIGSDDPKPTDAMLRETKAVMDWVRRYDQAGARVEGRHVKGHKDVDRDPPTQCPGSLYPYIGNGYFD